MALQTVRCEGNGENWFSSCLENPSIFAVQRLIYSLRVEWRFTFIRGRTPRQATARFCLSTKGSQPGASFRCPPLAVNDSRGTIKTCDLMRETKINPSDCLRTIMQSIGYWAEVIVDGVMCVTFSRGSLGGFARISRRLVSAFCWGMSSGGIPKQPHTRTLLHTIPSHDKTSRQRTWIHSNSFKDRNKTFVLINRMSQRKKQEEESQKQQGCSQIARWSGNWMKSHVPIIC